MYKARLELNLNQVVNVHPLEANLVDIILVFVKLCDR